MPTKKHSRDLSFVTSGPRGDIIEKSLEKAIMNAALASWDVGCKYTTIRIYAHSERGARNYGGEEGLRKFLELQPGDPLASMQVKVGTPSYWR